MRGEARAGPLQARRAQTMIAINRASRSGTVTSKSIAFLVAVQGVLSFAKTNFMCRLPMPGYTPISLTLIAEK